MEVEGISLHWSGGAERTVPTANTKAGARSEAVGSQLSSVTLETTKNHQFLHNFSPKVPDFASRRALGCAIRLRSRALTPRFLFLFVALLQNFAPAF